MPGEQYRIANQFSMLADSCDKSLYGISVSMEHVAEHTGVDNECVEVALNVVIKLMTQPRLLNAFFQEVVCRIEMDEMGDGEDEGSE